MSFDPVEVIHVYYKKALFSNSQIAFLFYDAVWPEKLGIFAQSVCYKVAKKSIPQLINEARFYTYY